MKKYGIFYVAKNDKVKDFVRSILELAKLNILCWDNNKSHIFLYNFEEDYDNCGLCANTGWAGSPQWEEVTLDQFIDAIDKMIPFCKIGSYQVKFDDSGDFLTANDVKFTYELVKEIIERMKA